MWSVIGHLTPLAALDVALRSGKPSHAYLFVGPPEIGKRRAALEFAAGLNCQEEDRPCGTCRNCRDTFSGQQPDVEVIEPGGLCDEPDHKDHADSVDLRICQVRRLERILSLSPYAGGRRVAIVDQADSLRAEAANAFLKTLEEPPGGSVIILLAERPERLPDTVLSRCQLLSFRRLRRIEIEQAVLERDLDQATASKIAIASDGRLGWALRAASDPAMLEEREATFASARRLARASRVERFNWAKGAEARSPEVKQRYLKELGQWELWWRDVLSASAGGEAARISNLDYREELLEEGKLYMPAEVVAFLRALQSTRELLRINVDPRLALEILMLDLPPSRPA